MSHSHSRYDSAGTASAVFRLSSLSLILILTIWALRILLSYHLLSPSPDTDFYSGKKSKPKMGAGESVKFLAASPYIRDLAALVVGYGMAINIVEVR
jgi:ATP/ADP translocase